MFFRHRNDDHNISQFDIQMCVYFVLSFLVEKVSLSHKTEYFWAIRAHLFLLVILRGQPCFKLPPPITVLHVSQLNHGLRFQISSQIELNASDGC